VLTFGGMNIVNGALIKWQPTYLGRYFHLNPAEYGLRLGLLYAFGGVIGMIVSGFLVDRWFARGNKTAHLDFYFIALLITAPIVGYGLISPSLNTYLVTVCIAKAITVNFLGYFAALIQMISPPRLRGRLSAIFALMVLALLGSSLGPLIPALISDHVLHDEIRMGRAIAVTLGIFAPIALLAMIWGRPAIKKAIADAEAWA
jgi:MFS family permease